VVINYDYQIILIQNRKENEKEEGERVWEVEERK